MKEIRGEKGKEVRNWNGQIKWIENNLRERRKLDKDKNGTKKKKKGLVFASSMMGDECASYTEKHSKCRHENFRRHDNLAPGIFSRLSVIAQYMQT